jgi:glutathione S-transferase
MSALIDAPTPRLVYFDLEGAAEKIRLTFSIVGMKFIDHRVNFQTEWPSMKHTVPNGQLPVLYLGGQIFTQSAAMCRWIARQGDGSLYPLSDVDKCLKIDELIGIFDDDARDWAPAMYMGVFPTRFGYPADYAASEEGKAKTKDMRETWMRDTLPRYMGHLKNALDSNSGKFLCGSHVTLADVFWLPRIRFLCSGVASHIPPTVLDGFPEVLAWKNRMMNVPAIKQWYERPE